MCTMCRARGRILRKAVMTMNNRALRAIAILGQLISVFPFVVLCEGAGYDAYIWWHYIAIYATIAVFYVMGRLCGAWAASPRHSRSFRSKAAFLSRTALAVPIILFMIVCGALELSTGLYLYVLPSAIIMFFGGHATYGREYTDIFTRAWFALYFVAGLMTNVILWFTRDDVLISSGGFQICFGFGALMIIAAVLTNQTTIDTCTNQRDSGRLVLPDGLRGYNAWLVAAVAAVTVGLFLFVGPAARLLTAGVGQILRLLLWLLTRRGEMSATDNMLSDSDGESGLVVDVADNSFAEATTLLLVIGIIVLMIVFRKQIAEMIRGLFAPLFKVQETVSEIAYSDEISEAPDTSRSYISRRKREQNLYKQFRREKDSLRKYRYGYKLMMLRLEDTAFATVPTDNTDIHRVKGENGLHSESVRKIVDIYNDVRYKGRVPTDEEISFAESFIEEIRR